MAEAQLTGALDIRISEAAELTKVVWAGKRWAYVNPEQEVNANAMRFQMRTKSVSQMINESDDPYEPEEVFAMIQDDMDMAKQHGFEIVTDVKQPTPPPAEPAKTDRKRIPVLRQREKERTPHSHRGIAMNEKLRAHLMKSGGRMSMRLSPELLAAAKQKLAAATGGESDNVVPEEQPLIPMTFGSEYYVERWYGILVVDFSDGAVDLERWSAGAPYFHESRSGGPARHHPQRPHGEQSALRRCEVLA